MTGSGDPERLRSVAISDNFLDVLGVDAGAGPQLHRAGVPDQRPAGRPPEPRVLAAPLRRRRRDRRPHADAQRHGRDDRRRHAGVVRLRRDLRAGSGDRVDPPVSARPRDRAHGQHAVRHRPPEARRHRGRGAGRSAGDHRPVQAVDQLRRDDGREGHAARRRAARILPAGLHGARRRGAVRPGDRLRQPVQPAAGADQRAAAGVRRAGRARRAPPSPDPADAGREPAARRRPARRSAFRWRSGRPRALARLDTFGVPLLQNASVDPVALGGDDRAHRARRRRVRRAAGLAPVPQPRRAAERHASAHRRPLLHARPQRPRRRRSRDGLHPARRRRAVDPQLRRPAPGRSRLPAAAGDGLARRRAALVQEPRRGQPVPRRRRAPASRRCPASKRSGSATSCRSAATAPGASAPKVSTTRPAPARACFRASSTRTTCRRCACRCGPGATSTTATAPAIRAR